MFTTTLPSSHTEIKKRPVVSSAVGDGSRSAWLGLWFGFGGPEVFFWDWFHSSLSTHNTCGVRILPNISSGTSLGILIKDDLHRLGILDCVFFLLWEYRTEDCFWELDSSREQAVGPGPSSSSSSHFLLKLQFEEPLQLAPSSSDFIQYFIL